MKQINNKKVADIIHTIGLNNNLRDEEVREIVEAQFRFTYERIKEMSLDTMSIEEINNLKTNFFYKYLGKVHTSGEIVERHRNVLIKKKKDRDEREHNSI